jgi:hypothetical protein
MKQVPAQAPVRVRELALAETRLLVPELAQARLTVLPH